MTESLWQHILLLLAIMMRANGNVLAEERAAFVSGVAALQGVLEPARVDAEGACAQTISPEAVRAWHVANAERADAIARGGDAALLPLLTKLNALPDKQALLDTLGRIARADMELCQGERDVILLAAAFWGLVRPRY